VSKKIDTGKSTASGYDELKAAIKKIILEQQKEEQKKIAEKQQENTVKCIVLFADLVGCSEISNEKLPWEYADVLQQFGKAAQEAFNVAKLGWWTSYAKEGKKIHPLKIMETNMGGDEVAIFLHPEDLRSDFEEASGEYDLYEIALRKVLMFAFSLKLNWLFSKYNIERLENKMQPRDIGIGIHCGNVYLQKNRLQLGKKKEGDKRWAAEGYAINLTKRIEGASRKGTETKVLISSEILGNVLHFSQNNTTGAKNTRRSILEDFGLKLGPKILEELKGITTYNDPLFELQMMRDGDKEKKEGKEKDASVCDDQPPPPIERRFLQFLNYVFREKIEENLEKVQTALEFYPHKWWLQAVAELGELKND
jgi:class 3 adenylate cyclase